MLMLERGCEGLLLCIGRQFDIAQDSRYECIHDSFYTRTLSKQLLLTLTLTQTQNMLLLTDLSMGNPQLSFTGEC
ncbi:MAG: hypothetical protein Q8J70_05835 [Thiobacillus sp.]|nr:hypothetical protein [Thiobacillus sp.]